MKKTVVTMTLCLMLVGFEATAQQTMGDSPTTAERLTALEEKLQRAIILTDRPCEELGEGWVPYGPIAGRFPLAAGEGRDDREEERVFISGEEGGEYQHQLTAKEMPVHRHSYKDKVGTGIRADYGDDEPTRHSDIDRKTANSGGGEPHNNMPPYMVLNFCWQR